MVAYIYLITNIATGKKYVGRTLRKPQYRLKSHIREALGHKTQMYLHKSIRKHGVENFNIVTLEECEKFVANEREIFWIENLNTMQPNGYNTTAGGFGGTLNATPELRKKLSDAKKGKPTWNKGLTKEDPRVLANSQAISKSLTGRVFSDQHKQNMSISQKRRSVS